MPETMKNQDDCRKIIEKYADTVYKLAFSKTGSKYDSDEIFQEVFLRYIKKKPIFNDDEHGKAWFIRVTINCTLSFIKKFKNSKIEEISENEFFEEKEYIDLYNELQKLPDNYREIIHLFYYEDMSVEMISKVLKRKPSTVRTQLTRARQMLKKYLKEEDYV